MQVSNLHLLKTSSSAARARGHQALRDTRERSRGAKDPSGSVAWRDKLHFENY
ncbi:hypothetical protein HanPI659440_Chr05g0208081 [Helianthus annuus]|nr:hypothetical protein HanPI659440_Chr05g0208081 [Helianthus annuus]